MGLGKPLFVLHGPWLYCPNWSHIQLQLLYLLSFINIFLIVCYCKCTSLCFMGTFCVFLSSVLMFLGITNIGKLFSHFLCPFQQTKRVLGPLCSSWRAGLGSPWADTRAALPVGSFPATQLNKVLLFVFEWWLVLSVTAGTALPATTTSL